MSGWLRAVLLAILLMVGAWGLLVLLARRLPPGLVRDLAGFVPNCVTTVRRLRRDPRVPRRAKLVIAPGWVVAALHDRPGAGIPAGNRPTG